MDFCNFRPTDLLTNIFYDTCTHSNAYTVGYKIVSTIRDNAYHFGMLYLIAPRRYTKYFPVQQTILLSFQLLTSS